MELAGPEYNKLNIFCKHLESQGFQLDEIEGNDIRYLISVASLGPINIEYLVIWFTPTHGLIIEGFLEKRKYWGKPNITVGSWGYKPINYDVAYKIITENYRPSSLYIKG